MTTELKKYLYKLVPKEDESKIIEDVIEARSLEEAVYVIDNNFCIAMFQEFDIRELKK